MYCESIRYVNYRNIERAEIKLSEGVNVFIGSNAQGKTNAIEGVYYFARGKSFRGAKDKELIRIGCESAELGIVFRDNARLRHHEVRLSATDRRICTKEGVNIRRMSEFIGSFRAVLFSPEHLSMVKEGPSERRSFADVAISQLYPAYMSALSRYQKILLQRNSVLKDSSAPMFNDTLEVLSCQLAREAAVIAEYRARYVERLALKVEALIDDMTCGRERATLRYGDGKSEEEYLRLLTGNTEKELRAGSTLYGPHKDDIAVTLNGNDARVYASQGQQRSIALAMKLGEGELSRDETGEYPVFLLDDILSELDERRKEYVLGGLEGRQVMITTCERIPEGSRVFRVADGVYCSDES
ncbi:MAG: DNA replication/repair protein RecF [Clostridia bacterium]|nr:DNA replication/repair protein RecF [Clostridia bacterium]